VIATTLEQIKALRAGGKILAGVLKDVAALAKEGVSTAELDLACEHAIRARGAVPAFLDYQPEGASYPFPAALCVALNDEVVHGIPNEKRILRNGDVLSIDAGLSYQGYFVDAARTLVVGSSTEMVLGGGEKSLIARGIGDLKAHQLVAATKEALQAAIAAVRPGKHTGDIGAAVMRVARNRGFAVVSDLGGHGVGSSVHEKPYIANEGREGEGEELVVGHVLAIEPMLSEGKGAIVLDEDEWTYRMKDGKRAAHFEDTVLVTESGVEVLTQ
jgi:methionyl aminopeptidase